MPRNIKSYIGLILLIILIIVLYLIICNCHLNMLNSFLPFKLRIIFKYQVYVTENSFRPICSDMRSCIEGVGIQGVGIHKRK